MIYFIMYYIHVLAAITTVGISIAFPIMTRSARTVSEARQHIDLFQKIKFIPHIGSIIVCLTSSFLLMLQPDLISEPWFILSLLIYFFIQVYTASTITGRLKKQSLILQAHTEEELPLQYKLFTRKALPMEITSELLIIVLIVLIIFKPT
ncbi:DUF2269 family protein [Paenibacillus yanchengensis]|uniref:DUF2269 family protein n=1 Tax=Paenibacillus yanchengensis TaxID=2035833 RepID=A0ABW4YPP1_9BACL